MRQNTTIQLIASENFTSPAVLAAQGSVLTNKYSEGYPAKRYYGGNIVVDEAEELARDRLCELFGAEHANVQPHSGANANMAAFLALLDPGDKVMGMRLDQGGHLTHGSPVNFSGRLYDFVSYGVDRDSERIDHDELRALALAERPKLIIAGATAYPRTIDFAAFREIADELRRAAHGRRRAHRRARRRRRPPVTDPVRRRRDHHHAQDAARPARRRDHVPRASTPPRSTRRCSRACRAGRSCTWSRPRRSRSRRRCSPSSPTYAAAIVRNAAALADALAAEGFRIVSGGTDNHLMLVDLRPFGVTGKVAQEALDRAGITCNKNAIPNDPEKPFVTSGLRLGTAAVTTAGMREAEMREISSLIAQVLRKVDDEDIAADVRAQAADLCGRFTPYPDL